MPTQFSLKRIFWVVLAIVLIVWIGVGVYYLSSTSTFPPSRQSSISQKGPTPTVSDRFEKKDYFIGYFKQWENIQGSKDKYLLLTNRQTGELLPKVRVVLGQSLADRSVTSFSAGKLEKVERAGLDNVFIFDPKFASVTFEEVEEFIQQGQQVKAFLKKQIDKATYFKDEKDNFVADRLLIFKE